MQIDPLRNTLLRLSLPAIVAASILLAQPARASSASWSGISGGDWNLGTNWTPAAAPGTSGTGSSSTDVATFVNGGGTSQTITDSATNRNLEEIIFSNSTTGSGGLGNFIIGSSSDTLYFTDRNGNPNISFTGTSNTVSETIASNIMMTGANGANDLRITGTGGNVTLTLSGNISTDAASGTSSIRILPAGATGVLTFIVNLSGNITDGSSAKVQVTSFEDGIVDITGTGNTYSGGYILGNNTGSSDAGSVVKVGVSSTGPAGAPTSGAFGTGLLQFESGTIESDGTAARTIANDFELSGAGSTTVVSPPTGYWLGDTTNTGTLTFTGNGTLDSVNANNIITQSNVVMSGNLSSTNSAPLLKEGSGALTLSGNNTYTGPTTVVAGTLLADGVSSTGTGAVTVDSGAILGGSGTISPSAVTSGNAAVTVEAGGILSPGDAAGSVGTLTLALPTGTTLNLIQGAKLTFDLAGVGASDLIKLTSGTLNLNNQSITDFSFNAETGFGAGTYTLIQTGNAVTGSLNSGSSNSEVLDGFDATLEVSGDNLVLSVVAVPEPSTWILLAGGGLILAAVARARKLCLFPTV